MYGVFFKELLLGTIDVKDNTLTFKYSESFPELNVEFISNFPKNKIYSGSVVFSFVLNRVAISEAKQAKNIDELILKSNAVGHSSLVIKRIVL